MRLLSRTSNPKATRASKTKAKRARPMPVWRRRMIRWSVPCLMIAALGGGLGWVWQSGTLSKAAETTFSGAIRLTADAGLRVDDLLVSGRKQTAVATLLAAVRISRNDPILAIDLDQTRERVEALPWVKSARVERQLPSTVLVTLLERRPLALWQRGGTFTLVDQDGDIITDRGLEPFGNLPIVIGDDAPRRAADALAMLAAEPELSPKIRALTWVGGRRWTVRLDSGIDVQLPESDPARAWTHLAQLAREHGVLERDVVTIDLRIPDQLILRVDPDARQRASERGENT